MYTKWIHWYGVSESGIVSTQFQLNLKYFIEIDNWLFSAKTGFKFEKLWDVGEAGLVKFSVIWTDSEGQVRG